MSTPKYWGFRTNWRNPEAHQFFWRELQQDRLRQGWGWLNGQELPECHEDRGARRNLPIYSRVKQGDYLLIPHVPTYGEVTIVKATQDFNIGYKYEIAEQKAEGKKKGFRDYGHIFPATFVKTFALNNKYVEARIRTSFKNRGRFWRLWECDAAIDKLIKTTENLCLVSHFEDRVTDAFNSALAEFWKEDALKECLKSEFSRVFQASDWEFVLVQVFRKLLPFCTVDRIGGKQEKEHGCDIKISMPGIEKDRSYVIGIQVKDYIDIVGEKPIEQVIKADSYWEENNINEKLIDKYVILIGANKERNVSFEQKAKDKQVSVLYEDGVAELLLRAAKIQMANNDNNEL